MSNSYQPDGSQQPPEPPPLDTCRKRTTTTIILRWCCVMCSVLLTKVCVGLLLPAVQASREAAKNALLEQSGSKSRLAMHNYHDTYKSFPPAYTVDADGQPLHSWRTLLLPFLDQKALYDQIDLSKPWNDPANAAFAATEISVFVCASMPETGKHDFLCGDHRSTRGHERSDRNEIPRHHGWNIQHNPRHGGRTFHGGSLDESAGHYVATVPSF
ncbi:MAG: DUF1559 domain-containing protein [Pirellulaceae bacterium]